MGRSHQKRILCMWGSSYRTARGRQQEDPGLSERPIGVLGMGLTRGRMGDRDFRTGTCARAGSREGGHVSTLGNPTGGVTGVLGNLGAVKWWVLEGKRRIYLVDQAAWPCQGSPNTGPAPLRKHAAAW